MVSRLPLNLRFKLGLELSLSDLSTLSLVDKKFNELYGSDRFWRLKLVREYGNYVDEKPATMSYRKLYMRLKRSGNIWFLDGRENTSLNHIYKYILLTSGAYYITASGKLYLDKNVEYSDPSMWLDLFGKLTENNPRQSPTETIYYLMDNIDNVAMSVSSESDSGVLILDLNHNMMSRGSYLNGLKNEHRIGGPIFLIRPHIREIGCTLESQFYYFITDSNVLYMLDGETQRAEAEPAKPILIAENVRQVSLVVRSVSHSYLTTIYYTDNSELSLHRLSADIYKDASDAESGKKLTSYPGYEVMYSDSEDNDVNDVKDINKGNDNSNNDVNDVNDVEDIKDIKDVNEENDNSNDDADHSDDDNSSDNEFRHGFELLKNAVVFDQDNIRNGDYFVNRHVTQLGIKDVINFAAGKKHVFVIDINNKLYAYDRNGSRTSINVVRPIRKIICDVHGLLTAYIDIIDDLYIVGASSLAYYVKNIPWHYTLEPVFMEHNVLDVVIQSPKLLILKKDEPNMFPKRRN